MPFVRMFLREKFNILLVDQRNHGDSEGDFPTYGYYEKDDLDRWIDFLIERKGEDIFIGLHGQSMGGATVLLCGSRNKHVKFVIDDCGYSTGKGIIKFQINKYKWIPFKAVYNVLNKKSKYRCGFIFEDVSPLDDICNSRVPILFIHGKNDRTVPCEMAEEMYRKRQNSNDKLYIVDNCDHMAAYGIDKERYESIVHEFIKKLEYI